MLKTRAELIWMVRQAGLAPTALFDSPLWHLAAAVGLHRVETYEERDTREIVETKKQEWEETVDTRAAKLSGYSERRRQRELERKQEKAAR